VPSVTDRVETAFASSAASPSTASRPIACTRWPARDPHRVARFELVKNHGPDRGRGALGERGARFELWLVGGGDGRARCERQVEALGLADRVRFLGYRDDVPSPRALGCRRLTSLKEGILAALEAMASRLRWSRPGDGHARGPTHGDRGCGDAGDPAGLGALARSSTTLHCALHGRAWPRVARGVRCESVDRPAARACLPRSLNPRHRRRPLSRARCRREHRPLLAPNTLWSTPAALDSPRARVGHRVRAAA
jgi:hypothetical protein